ncbi:MAG: VCBS repeat-containing protein [Planctomycetota bacterium]|nr:VCBS repeat-containing protein [Planctomycetota bacterium]
MNVLLFGLVVFPLSLAAPEAPDAPLLGDPRETVKFSKKLLVVSANEGSAIADIDRDGRLDVVAGRNWYRAPEFVPHALRHVEEFADYLHSNGDHVLDVNGDGWPDVLSSSFHDQGVWWYENPGAAGLEKGLLWKTHLLRKTHGENEVNYVRDIDGDGRPELIVNRWRENAPLVAWKLVEKDGSWTLEERELSPRGNAHGMGFGDINGDGREDILSGWGWWERPAGKPLENEWRFHRDWTLRGASCPMIVTDLNADGRNDVIWGRGHDYGLYWREQLPPGADGRSRWREHVIDRTYSQAHCLHRADIDGDGEAELITGKRVRAHSGKDPGGEDPTCLYYYKWDRKKSRFTRYTIDEKGGVGTGLQVRTADLDGDGRLDIVVGGKSGSWVLRNRGR